MHYRPMLSLPKSPQVHAANSMPPFLPGQMHPTSVHCSYIVAGELHTRTHTYTHMHTHTHTLTTDKLGTASAGAAVAAGALGGRGAES